MFYFQGPQQEQELGHQDASQLRRTVSRVPASAFSCHSGRVYYSTLLDYFKLFVDDKFVENVAACSQLYAVKKNMPEAQKSLNPNMIRTSQAIMFVTGYLTPSNRAMF
jgi:hypothetical protein